MKRVALAGDMHTGTPDAADYYYRYLRSADNPEGQINIIATPEPRPTKYVDPVIGTIDDYDTVSPDLPFGVVTYNLTQQASGDIGMEEYVAVRPPVGMDDVILPTDPPEERQRKMAAMDQAHKETARARGEEQAVGLTFVSEAAARQVIDKILRARPIDEEGA